MRICKDGRTLGQNNSYQKPEYKQKQRESHLGLKSPNWKGGKSLLKNKRKYKSQEIYLYSKENLEKLKRMGKRDQTGKNNPMYGKHHSDNTKRIMKEKKKFIYLGEKNPNWHSGISFLPYSPEFNDKLKEEIRKRDNFRCQVCLVKQSELRDSDNKLYKLIVHHIDLNKINNNRDNLVSLCRDCHLKVHYNKLPNVLQNRTMGVITW